MWQAILMLIAAIIPSVPSLVTDAENVFRGKPKSGEQKAASVIQFVAPIIETTSQAIAQLAPPGTDAQKIANSVNVYTKAMNDATVALANDLGAFPHTPTPESH
jgi:hypothetical protein